MNISFACEPSPGSINEDYVIATRNFVCVLDGATIPPPLETGCIHSTPWYVRNLAAQLAKIAENTATETLSDVLSGAIEAVNEEHHGLCDLSHPGTPSSTVSMLKIGAESAEYLVLCDSPLVLDSGGNISVFTDLRLRNTSKKERQEAFAAGKKYGFGSRQHLDLVGHLITVQRRYRNQPGGFWVAGSKPEAAQHALTGTIPLTGPEQLTRAALMSDGVSAAVDSYRLTDWTGLLDRLDKNGPAAVIREIRAHEAADATANITPRAKIHDDATVAYLTA